LSTGGGSLFLLPGPRPYHDPKPRRKPKMDHDFSLDPNADDWFPDGIDILPPPSYFIVIAAVLAACVVAIATMIRLLRVH
jgi:hypothetical protein